MEIRVSRTITTLREKNNLSQKDLAKKTGLSQSAISLFESGSRLPNAQSIVGLASALGTTTDYLLGVQSNTSKVEVK